MPDVRRTAQQVAQADCSLWSQPLSPDVDAVEFSGFALLRAAAIAAAIFFRELCRDEFFAAVIETIEMTDAIDAARRISPL